MPKIKVSTEVQVNVKKSGGMYEATCHCEYGVYHAASFTEEDAVQMVATSIREASDYSLDTEVIKDA